MTAPRRLRAGAALLTLTACAGGGDATAPDLRKLSSVVVGQSSRADVLGVMGRPSQVLRNARGEAWVYEAQGASRNEGRMAAGAQAAATVAGALIPFAGLVGAGMGLASAAASESRQPMVTTMTVEFAEAGVVRDCIYATNAMTTDDLVRADGRAPFDCVRPAPASVE